MRVINPEAKRSTSNCLDLPMSNWPAEVHAFEPVYGWIQRAAHGNYAQSTRSFLDGLGLDGLHWDFEQQLEVVGQLPIQDYSRLEWNTPKQASNGYKICGHLFAFRAFSKSVRRACPRCLDEDRFIRVWFDIVPIAACPIHGVALVEGLADDPFDWLHPECGWTRNGVFVKSEHSTPAAASELDRYIVRKLEGRETDVPQHLAAEPVQAVIHSAICLGRFWRSHEPGAFTYEDFRELAQLGFPALFGGRETIIDFLSEAAWLQPQYSKALHEARCRYAREISRTISSRRLRELITSCLTVVRIRNGVATPFGALTPYDGEDGCRTMSGVASLLGVHPRQVRKILNAIGVKTKRCAHTRAHRLTIADITALEQYVATSLSSGDVAKTLGCTVADVDELVNRRILKIAFRKGDARFFRRQTIEALIATALGGPSEALDAMGMSLASFATENGISLAAAYFQLIHNKKIGIQQYDHTLPFFHGAQVGGCRRHRVRPGSQIKEAITFAKARARLGTGLEGLAQLVELGYLKTVEDVGGQRRICGHSLSSFERAYVRAADYAPTLGCPPRSAVKMLRKKGIAPINQYGKRIVSFVARDEVQRMTGLTLEGSTAFKMLELIRDQIADLFASSSVPATVAVNTDPSILVEATSRKWSFSIERKPGLQRFQIVARFRAPSEARRLRKIQTASIVPETIWPGAQVDYQDGGGFVLVDEVGMADSIEMDGAVLAERSLARAQELHCIF